VPKVGTHGIRHRSATDIANSGVPLKVGMALTAHKTVAMLMRYVHTEDNPVRQAAELVATPGARPSRRRGSASPRRPGHERPDAQSSKRCRPCLPATPASTTA